MRKHRLSLLHIIPEKLLPVHEPLELFWSATMPGFEVEMRLEVAMRDGAPRDPAGEPMYSRHFPEIVSAEMDDVLDDPQPDVGPVLPDLEIEWTMDYRPGPGSRRGPDQVTRRRILRHQQDRCLYCRLPFGSWVHRKLDVEQLRATWDHRIPHSLTGSSRPEDFVAACQICNALKGSLVFRSLQDARRFLEHRWSRKGWRPANVAR